MHYLLAALMYTNTSYAAFTFGREQSVPIYEEINVNARRQDSIKVSMNGAYESPKALFWLSSCALNFGDILIRLV